MSEMREPTAGTTGGVHGHFATGHGAGGAASGGAVVDYGLPPTASPLVRLGGAMGIAACAVGLLVLIVACAGFNKVLALSLVPVGLSAPGLIVTLIGAIRDKHLISEDTHVLQALFVTIAGLLGGLLEMAAWLEWRIFPQ